LCSFFLPSFLSLSQDHFGTFNPASFTSDRVLPASSNLDSFVANPLIPRVLRSNASLELNCRSLFHARNSGSDSHPANVTV
jgi:hypothetical protein